MPCAGDPEQNCGGHGVSSVFLTDENSEFYTIQSFEDATQNLYNRINTQSTAWFQFHVGWFGRWADKRPYDVTSYQYCGFLFPIRGNLFADEECTKHHRYICELREYALH